MGTSTEEQAAFTAVDRSAQRLARLALLFINAGSPLSTSDVHRLAYVPFDENKGEEDDERKRHARYEKSFQRDRKDLAKFGLAVIDAGESEAGERLWRLDPASLVTQPPLSADEALVIDVMCRPLCADPGFAYADDLMRALLKLNSSFDEGEWLPEVRLADQSEPVRALYAAHLGHVPAKIAYCNASGAESERIACTLGLFQLRGQLYFVTFTLSEDGSFDLEQPRTLRGDRLVSVEPLSGPRYDVPAEFDVADYRKLPFQMGSSLYEGLFRVPDEVAVPALKLGSGARMEQADAGRTLSADVSDEGIAAAWAVAEGLVPVSPESLVVRYRELLEGVVAHGE